jgi:hypothetical protein
MKKRKKKTSKGGKIYEEKDKQHLFFMSFSRRPSLGVSTVNRTALNPYFSALCTSAADTSLFLYTFFKLNYRKFS